MKPTDFAKHLTMFFESHLILQRNLSANTIKSYRDTFSLFLLFMDREKHLTAEKIQLRNFEYGIINDFLNWLTANRNSSSATLNQRLSAIHCFAKYLQYEQPENLLQFQKILGIPIKKQPRRLARHIEVANMKYILNSADTNTKYGKRDAALLCLLYDSGARVSELINLKLIDLRLEPPAIVRLWGKRMKERAVPLLPQTVNVLKQYIGEFSNLKNASPQQPLFTNHRAEVLTRSGVTYIVKKYAKAACEQPFKISPHVFRHTKAMHLLQADVDLIKIRDLLGHTELATTEIYAKTDTEMKRKALMKISSNNDESVPSWHRDNELLCWLKSLG